MTAAPSTENGDMYFEKDNQYILTNVVGKIYNPLHEEIVGRACVLDYFSPHEFGRFKVLMDDGCWHRIHTSVVKDVHTTDCDRDVVVVTSHSVYTFSIPAEPVSVGVMEEQNAE